MNEIEYEFKRHDLEFWKIMYTEMIDGDKRLIKMDKWLIAMVAVVIVFCSLWGTVKFIEGDYIIAALEFLLVIINIGTSVCTVKRMIRVRKNIAVSEEKLEELDREYLELLEKERGLEND